MLPRQSDVLAYRRASAETRMIGEVLGLAEEQLDAVFGVTGS